MKANIRFLWEWRKCVDSVSGAKNTVSQYHGRQTSWDVHAILVEPRHRIAQRHVIHAGAPHALPIHGSPQFHKTAAQVESERLAARGQPSPPATASVAAKLCGLTHGAQGPACQQHQQYLLLHIPVIPAPGRDAGRQTGTGATAPPATKSWD